MSIEVKGTLLGLAAALGVLVVTFGLSPLLQHQKVAANQEERANADSVSLPAVLEGETKRGYSLFDRNCAHCHGEDARGEEGPNLHSLTKSDARIANIIKGGIKGEMPAFARKFGDADVQALVAYLRTLRD